MAAPDVLAGIYRRAWENLPWFFIVFIVLLGSFLCLLSTLVLSCVYCAPWFFIVFIVHLGSLLCLGYDRPLESGSVEPIPPWNEADHRDLERPKHAP